MLTAEIPADITKIKHRVMFKLTKRQLVCFGGGALIGVPLFLFLKSYVDVSTATTAMMLVMMPCFAFGLYEKDGQPLEVVLRHMIETRFLRPRKRLYRTENVYSLLEIRHRLRKEVQKIVRSGMD